MFNFMVLDVDESRIKEINRLLYGFIWHKKERIQRNTLIGDIDRGGIGMIDIESKIRAIRVTWVKHLLGTHTWSSVLEAFLSKLGINIELLLKCNFNSEDVFPCIKGIPTFYREVFVNLNRCKSANVNQSKDNIFSEVIWGNMLFMKNGTCLYEKNWIKSGVIYVKDLIHNDTFIDAQYIMTTLKYKVNWISEYTKIKSVMAKKLKAFDTARAKYVNIKTTVSTYNICNKIIDIECITCKEVYKWVVNKKFQRPKMERVWCKEFQIEKFQTIWQSIYETKIKYMPIQKIKEFNYKLMTNVLICGNLVCKWNTDVSEKCDVCSEINTVKHMIYDCSRVRNIWHKISEVIRCDISWKHIVIGIKGSSILCRTYNTIIAITAYTIYAEWVKCLNSSKKFKNVNLLLSCKHNLLFNCVILQHTSYEQISYCIKGFVQKIK